MKVPFELIKTIFVFLMICVVVLFYTSQPHLDNWIAILAAILPYPILYLLYKSSKIPFSDFAKSRTFDVWSVGSSLILALLILIPNFFM